MKTIIFKLEKVFLNSKLTTLKFEKLINLKYIVVLLFNKNNFIFMLISFLKILTHQARKKLKRQL